MERNAETGRTTNLETWRDRKINKMLVNKKERCRKRGREIGMKREQDRDREGEN